MGRSVTTDGDNETDTDWRGHKTARSWPLLFSELSVRTAVFSAAITSVMGRTTGAGRAYWSAATEAAGPFLNRVGRRSQYAIVVGLVGVTHVALVFVLLLGLKPVREAVRHEVVLALV